MKKIPNIKYKKAVFKKVKQFKQKFSELGITIEKVPNSDAESRSKRRNQVWMFIQHGVPEYVQAELLGVSSDTVRRDIKHWKDELGGDLIKFKNDMNHVAADLGVVTKKIDSILETCMLESSQATNSRSKIEYLNTALKAISLRSKILVDTGFYPKAGVEVSVRQEKKITFSDKFGKDSPLNILDDPVKRRKVLSVVENLVKHKIGTDSNDKEIIIDAINKKKEQQ